MRGWFLRVFTFVALPLILVASQPVGAGAQRPDPRALALAFEPVIQTRIEALLATPNLVLQTDYYRIDMRFGPSMRLDAVVVEAADSRTRLKWRGRLPARHSPVRPHPESLSLHRTPGSGGHVNRGRRTHDAQAGVRSGARDSQQHVASEDR